MTTFLLLIYQTYIFNTEKQTGAIKSTVTASEDWSINYTLQSNGTVRIEVYGNIGTSITDGEALDTKLLAVGTGASSAATIKSNSNVAVTGQRITKNAGSISVARDASTPASSLLDDTGSVKTVFTNLKLLMILMQ
jgi:hypothetical protein